MRKIVLILILLACSVTGAQTIYTMVKSFNAGKLSVFLNAREDLEKYHSGCSEMQNMIPLPQGSAEKRPGTKYITDNVDDNDIRLMPFQYSVSQSYVICIGDVNITFYKP